MNCPLPGREKENKATIVSGRQRMAAPLCVGLAGFGCECYHLNITHGSPSLTLHFIRGLIKL